MIHRKSEWFLGAVIVGLGVSAARAAGPTANNEIRSVVPAVSVSSPQASNAPADDDQARTQWLAERYQVSSGTIDSFRQQDVSWADIGRVLAISRRSGQTPEQIWSQREDGMSWKKIAKRYSLSEKDVNQEVKSANQDLRTAARLNDPDRETDLKNPDRSQVPAPPTIGRNAVVPSPEGPVVSTPSAPGAVLGAGPSVSSPTVSPASVSTPSAPGAPLGIAPGVTASSSAAPVVQTSSPTPAAVPESIGVPAPNPLDRPDTLGPPVAPSPASNPGTPSNPTGPGTPTSPGTLQAPGNPGSLNNNPPLPEQQGTGDQPR